MPVETLDDILNDLADKIGVYGSCPFTHLDGCEKSCQVLACCRVGFMMEMRERIENAMEIENKINQK